MKRMFLGAASRRRFWSLCLLPMLLAFSPAVGAETGSANAAINPKNFSDPLTTPAAKWAQPGSQRILALARAGQRLVAVGQRGTILLSDNAGESWRQAGSPVSIDLTGVHFVSDSEGWAVGHDGVLMHSKDGGESWAVSLTADKVVERLKSYYTERAATGDADAQAVLDEVEADIERERVPAFFNVHFMDSRRGFIIGTAGLILQTEDGGTSWTPWIERVENPDVAHLYDISSSGDELWLAGELGFAARFDADSGRFVKIDTSYRGTFFTVTVDGRNVLLGGLRGHLFASANGGESWDQVTSGQRLSVVAATKLSDGTPMVATQNGAILAAPWGSSEAQPGTEPMRRQTLALIEADEKTAVVATDIGLQRVPLSRPAR